MERYQKAEMEIIKITPLDMLPGSMIWCVDKSSTGCGFDGGSICNADLPDCGGFEIEID